MSNQTLEGCLEYRGFRYRFRARMQGHAECVLVLGGAFQSLNSWNAYLPRYERHLDTIVCDLPGMGDSDTLPHGYPMEFLADCIEHLQRAVGVRRTCIKAASYGTPIARTFAAKYPERVSRIVLAGTMNRIPDDLVEDTMESVRCLQDGRMDDASAIFLRLFVSKENDQKIENSRLAQKLLVRGIRTMSTRRKENYVENTLRLLTFTRRREDIMPSTSYLVVTGRYDSYTRPAECREVACILPSAQFTLIDNADHLAHIERPDVVGGLICDFLTGDDIRQFPGCIGYEAFGTPP